MVVDKRGDNKWSSLVPGVVPEVVTSVMPVDASLFVECLLVDEATELAVPSVPGPTSVSDETVVMI